GVYVARGGWYGQAEIVLFGGRGPAALEIYWDGVPYLPLGRDSIYIDPARIPLAPLERVDVIVLPASLRIYLVTARARSTAAGTQIASLTVEAGNTWRRANVTATARLGAGGFPQQLEARAGWAPVSFVTVSGAVRHSSYTGGRTGDRGYLTAGIRLPLGFSARAEGAWQRDVQAMFVANDPLQQMNDIAGWVRFDHPRLMVEVGRGRRDPFTPLGFAAGITTVRALHPTPLTDFVAGHAS